MVIMHLVIPRVQLCKKSVASCQNNLSNIVQNYLYVQNGNNINTTIESKSFQPSEKTTDSIVVHLYRQCNMHKRLHKRDKNKMNHQLLVLNIHYQISSPE